MPPLIPAKTPSFMNGHQVELATLETTNAVSKKITIDHFLLFIYLF